jgi:hypothetical protein
MVGYALCRARFSWIASDSQASVGNEADAGECAGHATDVSLGRKAECGMRKAVVGEQVVTSSHWPGKKAGLRV